MYDARSVRPDALPRLLAGLTGALLLIALAATSAQAGPATALPIDAAGADVRLSAGFARWTPGTLVPPEIPEPPTTPEIDDGKDAAGRRALELDPLPLRGLTDAPEAAAETGRSSWVDALALGRGNRLAWTRGEKALMWSYVSLSAVDTYQTLNIPDGGVEANPLLTAFAGDPPGEAETVLFKAATTYGTLKLADLVRNRKGRRWVLIAVTALQAAVVVHNEQVTGGIVF